MAEDRKTRLFGYGRVDIWLAGISSVVLAAMMMLVVVGAVMRYAWNAPIVGGNELLEMGSVAVIMLALPYCTTSQAHIRIDLFDPMLGRFGRLVTDVFANVLALIVLFYLARSYVVRTLDAFEFEDTTNMMDIPIWPFYGLVAFGIGAYALVLLLELVQMAVRSKKVAS
jgi:TRAP-type C4-dicarboxylate transport system permease small subunit